MGRFTTKPRGNVVRLTKLLVIAAFTTPLSAQAQLAHIRLAAGAIGMSTPISSESGLALSASHPVALTRTLSLVPGLEWARVRKGTEDSVCIFVNDDGDCLNRPKLERLMAANLMLDWRPWPQNVLGAYVALGGAVVQSLSAPNPGEQRRFVAPQVGTGMRIGGEGEFTFNVDLLLRRSNRWGVQQSQVTGFLLFGLGL